MIEHVPVSDTSKKHKRPHVKNASRFSLPAFPVPQKDRANGAKSPAQRGIEAPKIMMSTYGNHRAAWSSFWGG